MTRPIRLTLLACLIASALALAALPSLLPPAVMATPAPHWDDTLTVRGAYHVHSNVSDGTGSHDEIAAAAARAGLQFVVFTDHGDGTREIQPPQYRHGVLCIDAVEVNTRDGHLVALGMRRAPFRLAGTAASVLEDVHRLGGIGIAAHPGSPRASLRWHAWQALIDGLEWLNADSEWRDELGSLGRLMLTYALRPAETLTSTLDRPAPVLSQWDTLTADRRIVGLGGADAHARLGFRQQTEPYEEGWHLKIPSYEEAFRAFTIRVPLDARLSADPVRDANDILARLHWGRVFTLIDGLAGPGAFEFTATSGRNVARLGDYLDVDGPVALHVRMAAPPDSRLIILRNGEMLFDTADPEAHVGVGAEPAVYRVEIYLPGGHRDAIPWVVSNPIYVGMRGRHEERAWSGGRPAASGRSSVATEAWVAEASPGSTSTLAPRALVDGVAAIEWRYQLADGSPAGQFAAVNFPATALAGHDRLQLRARAGAPMRLWVQLRASRKGEAERWGTSIYLDENYRALEVFFADFEPLDETSTERPPLEDVDVLLLVVDTVNTTPGTKGELQFADMWLGRP